MNKTTKILLGVGLGVGVAVYLYNRNKKSTAKSGSVSSDDSSDAISDVLEGKLDSREEQIAYIIENTDANSVEQSSGFDGVEFKWNPKLGAFYPQGTLTVGDEPKYMDSVFYSADGTATDDPAVKAEDILESMTDEEIKLAYNLVKYRKNNPSAISEEDAFREIGGKDPKIVNVITTRIKPKLNDIKILKKNPKFKERWNERKKRFGGLLKKVRKCGRRPILKRKRDAWNKCIDSVNQSNGTTGRKTVKDLREAQKRCGRRPILPNKLKAWKECASQSQRQQATGQVAKSVEGKSDFLGLSEKEKFNQQRQMKFANEVTNRQSGALFGGHRWDGRSNDYEENIVRKGIL
jgi:hypothetical protein